MYTLNLTIIFGALLASAQEVFINPLKVSIDISIVVYTRVAPITLRYAYHPWDNFLMAGHDRCSSSTVPDSSYCPIRFHLQRAVELLQDVISSRQTFGKPESKVPIGSPQCTNGEPPFPSLFVNEEILSRYLQELRHCAIGMHSLSEDVIMDYIQPINSSYYEAHKAYDASYYNDVTSLPLNATHAASLATVDSLGLLHIFAETRRWEEAVRDCKFRRVIPGSLVKLDTLETALGTVFSRSRLQNYTPAVAIDLESVSFYWSHQGLTDCAFSTVEAFGVQILLVRALVPLKRINTLYTFNLVQSLHFHHIFDAEPYICFVEGFLDEQAVVFESVRRNAYHLETNDCGPDNKLCYLGMQRRNSRLSKNGCAETILRGSSSYEVATKCQLTCEPLSNYHHSLFLSKLNKNTVYLSGGSENSVFLNCAGSSVRLILPEEGGLEVTLGCGCYIDVEGDLLHSEEPCIPSSQDRIVLPVHFAYNNISRVVYSKM